jgi:PAS domain S-box-containing protein
LVELNIVGVLIADISGKVLEANSAFLQMVGYTREDLLEGKFRWDKMTPPEYHNLDASAIKQLRTNGIFPPYEKEYVRKDGKRIPVIISGATLEEDQEKGVAFVIDLSERKQSEERIKEQAELLNKTQDAIIVLDLENRIRFCNIRTPYFYGLEVEPEELVGKKVYEVVYEADSFKIEEAKRTTTEKGKWKGELHQKTKDGKELIVQSQWTLVRDGYGRPKSILIVNSDVSEKKKLETQFLRAQRLESLGILAGGIAHDLNNVLHPIMMALQLLRKKITDEQGANWINTLEVSAERGADLVKQILSFARGMEGEHRLLQLRHLISEMQKILKDTLPKSIEIHTDFPTDLWTIIGDPTQLHQVLMNLCLNSQDAMPHGGRLSISGENLFFDENYAQMNIDARVGPYIVITVSDTGTGIPPEIVERIFEPFFTTKEPGKGTGLGLSTAFGIVKSHGGFMHVYSEVGKGTRVKVYLPIIETTEIRGIEDKNIKDLPIGRGELILVIDDEAAIRDISSATLKKYGYRVITANDGADGLALYVQNKLEIKTVIVDMAMPIMNGRATIQALRKINPDIKIIAISGGQHEENHVEAARRVNANTFLFKPFTTETLLKTLKKVLLSNPEV